MLTTLRRDHDGEAPLRGERDLEREPISRARSRETERGPRFHCESAREGRERKMEMRAEIDDK